MFIKGLTQITFESAFLFSVFRVGLATLKLHSSRLFLVCKIPLLIPPHWFTFEPLKLGNNQ